MQRSNAFQPSSRVRVLTRREAGCTITSVTGDVDLSTADQLRDELARAIAPAPAVLIVDLTDVGFLASAGLQVLVDVHRLAAHTRLAIVAAAPATRRPLTITDLHHVLEIYPSLDKALEVLSQR